MNSEQPPLSPERPESARAYRAFCIYRDLGPDRSLDRAWKQFCADKGKDRGSARRPGYWSNWSQTYTWVNRARAHDATIDAEQRSAEAEQRRQLRERRLKFQIQTQQSTEDNVHMADLKLEMMAKARLIEVTEVKCDPVTGNRTTTKIRAFSGTEAAALMRARNEMLTLATKGPIDLNDSPEIVVPRQITWIEQPPTDQSVARRSQASDRGPCDAKDPDPDPDPEWEN